MVITIIGTILATIGVALTTWSAWFARVQAQKFLELERRERINSWATLDRAQALILTLETITNKYGYVTDDNYTTLQLQVISRVHKALCDQYIRTAEHLAQQYPQFNKQLINQWVADKSIITEWGKDKFMSMLDNYSHIASDKDGNNNPQVDS